MDAKDQAAVCETAFNHHDAATMQSPYAFYADVRRRCPVAHSDQLGGFYIAVAHETAKQVLSDYANFSSTEGVALPKMASVMYPIDLDPPLQTKYRLVLNRFFSLEEAQRRTPLFQEVVDGLIDGFIEVGAIDAATGFTRPALNAIMLPLIGIPSDDQAAFTAAIDYLSNDRTTDEVKFAQTNAYVFGSLMTLSAGRRAAGDKRDDYLQLLIDTPIDGALLSDEDVAKVLLVTLFGALDTTHATLNESLLHLARHPDDKQRLLSEEVKWATAVEEFVRFASPIQGLRRTAAHDQEFAGVQLRKGDPIIALNAAGNRDPAVFDEPDRCLLSRDARQHLGFGSGAHICLGRNFARTIIRTVLSTVLARLGDFDVPAGFTPEYTAGEGRRMRHLPITFTPDRPRAAAAPRAA